jgi:signal transduction histidine kinase
VGNAVEAIGESRGTITVTVAPPGNGDANALLSVRDTGHGMTREIQARIFDPFFSTRLTGRGLGLAVVMGIVRSLGGTVEVQSDPGAGSTLRVSLPVER